MSNRGLQLSIRTLNRAKVGLGITTTREGFGLGSEVYWSLPKPNPEPEKFSVITCESEPGDEAYQCETTPLLDAEPEVRVSPRVLR